MGHYVGLDVSLKLTSICVVDQTGSVVREGVVDSDPEAIAAFVRSDALVRIGLETGPTATWLWTELKRLDLPVICIDARLRPVYFRAGAKIMAKSSLRLVSPDSELRTVGLRRRSNRDMGRDREHLTELEVERLIKVAKGNRHGHRDATMILVAFRHGLRVSELCGLQWTSIAFETGTLHVRRVKGGEAATHPAPRR
jgi:integrase